MELIWTLDYNLHSNYQTKTVVIDKKCWWNTASNLRCLSCRSVWTNFPKSCPSSWRLRGWVRLSWSISTLIIVQYVVVWSDKAAEAHCWMRYFWHLAVACALHVIDLSLPVSLSGSDWDHTEVSEVEAAELCQRVSELLCLLHLIFVSHSATFLRLSHSAASLPSVSTPHGENITGFWCFILALFWLCPSVCSQ